MIRWASGLIVVLAGCQAQVPTPPLPTPNPVVSLAPAPVPTPTPTAPSLEELEAQMADLVNQERIKHGVAPLRYSLDLARVAERYSQRMIEENFFEHTDPQGDTVGDRLRDAGLTFQTVGENIGYGRSMEAIQRGFLASATHRAVMLDARWTEMGLGIEKVDEGESFTGEGEQILVGSYVITQIYRLPKSN